VLTVGDNKIGQLWELATGRELLRLTGHAFRVNGAAFSGDGLRLATASTDQTARIWDAKSGAELRSLRHAGLVYSVAFSPDGRRIVTATQDKHARIWDSAAGTQLLQLDGHRRSRGRCICS
jgi:WD40 repeat protein